MAIQPTYPGVYVQEVSSGVRTIVGVATSIGLFIGRAARGPLFEPILCLNISDFERVFSNDTTFSELPRAIRLFFQNGGTQCYVVRIADGAVPSTVNLRNENQADVLTITAKAAGQIGDSIRLGVTYGGQHPESNFNLEVFRWETNSTGQRVRADQELWQGLSMDPTNPRYAASFITQNSQLINITDLNANAAPAGPGVSLAGRVTPDGGVATFLATWQGIFGTGLGVAQRQAPYTGTSSINMGGSYSGASSKTIDFLVDGNGGATLTFGTDAVNLLWDDGMNNGTINIPANYAAGTPIAVNEGVEIAFGAGTAVEGERFSVFVHQPGQRLRMSANGGQSWSDIDFQGQMDFNTINNEASLLAAIQAVVNTAFPVGTITVSFQNGPANAQRLQFASPTGDVRIEPAASNDLARLLLLGSAQGGIETSRYASRRPTPTGHVFNITAWADFAGLPQNSFDSVTIGGTQIDLENSLQNVASVPPALMYQDAMTPSSSGGFDGVREKLAIIANAVNNYRLNNPQFTWSAQVAGQRLVINNLNGSDNTQGTLVTGNMQGGGGTNISTSFHPNVRYYSLGPNGQGNFQTPGATGNDGNAPTLANFQTAYNAVERAVDLFNLMVLPRDAEHTADAINSIWGPASIFCQQQRAFLLIDPPDSWTDVQAATHPANGVNSLRTGLVNDHSAVYYPRVIIRENGLNVPVGPSGAIAGLMARIDSNRGVWKAPAGTEASLRDIVGLEQRFSDRENGVLNPQGINTLRVFPNGIVSWGARTMDGDDDFASEWKYVPIRRLALFIEESLYRGLQWVVFEPNDEPLWAQIRLNVGAFMNNLFRQNAFQGQKRSDAYFVKCDSETTTQNDINLGIVNVWVGFAPLKPAEFVILKLQQIAGQIEV